MALSTIALASFSCAARAGPLSPATSITAAITRTRFTRSPHRVREKGDVDSRAWRARRADAAPLAELAVCRAAEHYIEAGGQFADARVLDRGKVHDDGSAGFRVANAGVDEIALVGRLSFDIALRGQQVFCAFLDLEVDVGRAPGVLNRFDRAEIIFAARSGQEPAEALEIGVALVAV